MVDEPEIIQLKRELAYYKSQLDVYSGEAIGNQYNIAQMANQLTQLRNGFSIISHIQQSFSLNSAIETVYENLFELVLQHMHMDRIVVLECAHSNLFKPWIGRGFNDDIENVSQILLPAALLADKGTLIVNGQHQPTTENAPLREFLKCPFIIACAYLRNQRLYVLAAGRVHERRPMSYAAFTEIDVFVLASLASVVNAIDLQITKHNLLEEERSRIARDMHDDIGSELSKISLYTQALTTKKSDADAVELYTTKIIAATSEVVENLGNIVWTLNPENNNLQNLVAYLREFTGEYLDLHCLNSAFVSDVIPDKIVGSEVRKNVLMVIKEALRNCVKHARATTVSISIKAAQNQVLFCIADDGVGIQTTRQFGNGLKNMQQRMAMIGGTLEFEKNSPSGTIISMHIPLS